MSLPPRIRVVIGLVTGVTVIVTLVVMLAGPVMYSLTRPLEPQDHMHSLLIAVREYERTHSIPVPVANSRDMP